MGFSIGLDDFLSLTSLKITLGVFVILKRNLLIISFSIILFSLSSAGLALAQTAEPGEIWIRVRYKDSCPRYKADVFVLDPPKSLGTTNENGLTSRDNTNCSFLQPGDYEVRAYWPDGGTEFGPLVLLTVDANCSGWRWIQSYSYYPNGTINCGASECQGKEWCLNYTYSGETNYAFCDSWLTDCDTKKCCNCSAWLYGMENGGWPAPKYDPNLDSNCTTCQECSALDTCSNASSGTDPKNDCVGNCDQCDGLGSCASFDSLCTGDCDYCNNGNCAANETVCELMYCSDCSGSGTSFSCTYDGTEDEDCPATNCPDSCDIDSEPFNFDYANDEPNYCQALNQCTSNSCNYNHVCADSDTIDGIFNWESVIRTCTAECDEHADCVDKCIGDVKYYSGSCNLASTCVCSYSTEDCNYYDGCYAYDTGCEDRNYFCTSGNCDYTYWNRNTDSYDSPELYCSAETIRNRTRFHDWYCNGDCTDHESWVNDHLEEDCDAYDDYYDTGQTRWVSTGECTEKEQKEQTWQEWICNSTLPVHCSYYNTTTRWIDTGNTRNKPDTTPCDDGLYCTDPDTCTAGVCGGGARDCSDSVSCTVDTCDEVNDKCDNTPNDGLCPTDTVCADYYCHQTLDCQVNYEPDTTECRPSAGDCDVAEFCTGSSADCPTDQVRPNDYICRIGGLCDIDEYCDGINVDCPTDIVEPSGTDCGICAECDGLGSCIYDDTQDADCLLCQECSGLFTCSNAASGTDPKNECIGNCDNCDGAGSCASFEALCTGDCDQCSGSGNNYNCAADQAVCELLKCADCTGSGTSFSCTYAVENEDCPATSCPDGCGLNPDNNPFTWDYANDEPNYCQALDTCTNNPCSYSHTCADADDTDGHFLWDSVYRTCTAPCDQDVDCSNECIGNKWYSFYRCGGLTCACEDLSDPICMVGKCGAECDSNDDCVSGLCFDNCTCYVEGVILEVTIELPENCTDPETCTVGYYYKQKVPLNFTVNPDPDWIRYGLNDFVNVSITGNTTLTMPQLIDESLNDVTVFAGDNGNEAASETRYFFYCRGDVNKDRIVDIVDIVSIAIHFGGGCGNPMYNPDVDLNDDCLIDIVDVVTVALEFGDTC